MVQLNFNAAGVKPNAALEPVPSGQYPVMITKSEQKPTKNGRGQYIELEMTIQGGEFGGRKLFDRLNIINDNQTAVDIAYGTLSAICHVTNRLQIQNTEQLHGVPFVAVAIKKEREDQPGSFSNEVKGYKDINGNDPGFAGNTQGGNGGGQPAWANNGGGQNQQTQQPQNNGNQNMNGGAGQTIDHQPQQGQVQQNQQPQNSQPSWQNQQQVQQDQTQQAQQPQNGQVQQGGTDVPPWARGGNAG